MYGHQWEIGHEYVKAVTYYVNIQIPDQGSHFSVDPEKLFLKPGEEHEVIVSFSPKDPMGCEER